MSEDSEMKTVMKEMINVMKELVKFMQKIEPLQAGGTSVDTSLPDTSNMQQASVLLEQHKFLQKLQQEGESITNFVADLKMAATYCNFVCTGCKHSTNDIHLRSQFIRGIRDNGIREQLLQQKEDVTFAKVVELALQTTKVESGQIQTPCPNVNVDQVSMNTEPRKRRKRGKRKKKDIEQTESIQATQALEASISPALEVKSKDPFNALPKGTSTNFKN
jgi:hypothetical protein